MSRRKVKATKLTVGLPFNLGELEFEPDEVEQIAAWELYVELATRVATQPLDPDQGIIRESLASLHSVFGVTREVLKKAGPSVAQGPESLGAVAIEVLNTGLRPFLAKWHPLLRNYEQGRPPEVGLGEHERTWEHTAELRQELAEVQEQMMVYMDALAKISGVSTSN